MRCQWSQSCSRISSRLVQEITDMMVIMMAANFFIWLNFSRECRNYKCVLQYVWWISTAGMLLKWLIVITILAEESRNFSARITVFIQKCRCSAWNWNPRRKKRHFFCENLCSTLLQGVSGLLQSASSFRMRCQWSQICSRMASWSKVLHDTRAKTAARIIDVSFFIIL